MRDFPGGGVLIGAGKGLFLARTVNGALTVAPAGTADTGGVPDMRVVPGGGVLIGAAKGLFFGVPTPLSNAKVDIRDKENLDKSSIDVNRDLSFVFTIERHACVPAADKLDLKVRVTAPGDKPTDSPKLTPTSNYYIATITLPWRIDKPDQWLFQIIATSGGADRLVGDVQKLTFVNASWWERWWRIFASVVAMVLAFTNFALFALARRSARAWRLATDDSWGTGVLRVATLLMTHIPKAQLWIIDRYFQRIRKALAEAKAMQAPRPFLPLPLTASDGRLQASDEATAPPWNGRRLWVQGASGMGKTALFQNVTESHFRDNETAYTAYAKWGFILVTFAARDFAGSGEDKDDPAWVLDAVKATLSSEQLTFANSALLTRFLEGGTIGVAIDGLNEVDRSRAVAAFTRAFEAAPMLVTSQQQPDNNRFTTWSLPTNIRNFTSELLRLYLVEQAETVDKRITVSGLKDAIRSGYDVRLIIDLARPDPDHAELPADRMGLYAAVIKAGWPTAPEEVRKEQQSLAAAAAWRMVSERKPNEDMRRLKPDIDLPATLLGALADAPQKYNTPVRLVRRVGNAAYEFVHDQMHAYLAARWFTQNGLSVLELEKMVVNSTIWTHSPDARRTL
jgi:hypothetical protein